MQQSKTSERPFVILNVATSADGKTDSVSRRGTRISSPQDMERVDRLRAECDAVMVGGNTLLGDDPKLTVKSPELRAERLRLGLPENPAKVGIREPRKAEVGLPFPHRRTGSGDLVFTTTQTDPAQIERLRDCGAEVYTMGEQLVDLEAALRKLRQEGIRRLLVEGGGTLNASLLRLNLVDQVKVYVAPFILGGSKAPTYVDGAGYELADAIPLRLDQVEDLEGGGVVLHYSVNNQITEIQYASDTLTNQRAARRKPLPRVRRVRTGPRLRAHCRHCRAALPLRAVPGGRRFVNNKDGKEHAAFVHGDVTGRGGCARAAALRMPDRRRDRLAALRLPRPARSRPADDRQNGERHPALPAPGRARHRLDQQDPRLRLAGLRLRHRRGQPGARVSATTNGSTAWLPTCSNHSRSSPSS